MISNLITKLIDDIKRKQNEVDLNSVDLSSVAQPASDPTYSSGFDYARSIAGGMPMSQVIAPGVSYSPEQPMGYTQEQLNTALGTTPVEPPQKLPGPGEEGYGQGIGGVTIFDEIFDIKRRPPRDLPPGTRSMFGGDPRDLPIPLSSLPRFNQAEMTKNIARTMRESGMDFTNLFGMPKFDIPTVDKGVGTDTLPPLPPIDIEDIIRKPGVTTIEEAMEIPKRNNQLFIDDMPIIDKRISIPPTSTPPIMPPMDAPVSLPDMLGIPAQTPPIMPPMNVPPMNVPPMNVPPVNLPSMVELPPIGGIGKPNQNRFSIQQLPMGLF